MTEAKRQSCKRHYQRHLAYYKQYRKDYYRKNRLAVLAMNKVNRDARVTYMRTAKDKPCADCGQRYPFPCMEFDHVRGKKLFNVASVCMSIDKLAAEIAKCDVVCANCHRIRTYSRKGHSLLSLG